MANISIDSRRTDEGVGAFELVSNRPARIDETRRASAWTTATATPSGLQKRTVEYGCPVGAWLYRLEFNAPVQHYFDRYLRDFEDMTRSVTFQVPGA